VRKNARNVCKKLVKYQAVLHVKPFNKEYIYDKNCISDNLALFGFYCFVLTFEIANKPVSNQYIRVQYRECNTAGYLHSVLPLYGRMTSLSYNKYPYYRDKFIIVSSILVKV
jgi:hypothetical protein